MITNPYAWWALLAVMNIFWGASYSVVKFGLNTMDSSALVFWRIFLSFILISIYILIKRPSLKLSRSDIVRISLTGLLMASAHSLWVAGVGLSHATDASLLYSFEPIIGILLATVILRERLYPTTIIGLIIVIIGLFRLADFDLASFDFSSKKTAIGNLMIVSGIICEGLFSVILKPVAKKRSASVVTAGTFLVASAVMLLISGNKIFSVGHWSYSEALSLAYLIIICTVIGYTLWVRMMKDVPVGVMMFTLFIQPVAGTFIASVTLREVVDERVMIGGTLLLAGMMIAVIGHANRSRITRRISLSEQPS
jgi:drug/metabolite transporter (DMT)-like permease